MKSVLKHKREFARDLREGTFETTAEGILFPSKGVLAVGEYVHMVNGADVRVDRNLIVDEGLKYMLGAALGAVAKLPAFYLALYSGAVSPAANWTAANFAATANEIVSTTEGYTEATRPVWTPGTPTTQLDNTASLAVFTIATASQLNVNGAALLSSNTRGGTTGVLVSAARYANVRTLAAGDTYQVGYRVTLLGS